MNLIIGSHVSYNNKSQLLGSVKEALSYKANTFMFYTGAPQNTNRSVIEDSLTMEAYKLMKENNIALENEIKNIKDYTYLILTSKNAVDIFFDKLDEMDLDSRVLANLKVCAIGSATAKEIKNRGIKADVVPEKFVAEYLFEELKDILKDSDKVLIPRSKNARDFLVDKISEICEVKEVHIYETVLDDSKKDEVLEVLNSEEANYITFASSSTVTNFVEIIGQENIDKLNKLKVISIGPITTQTAKDLNISIYKEADIATIDGMIDCIMNDK